MPDLLELVDRLFGLRLRCQLPRLHAEHQGRATGQPAAIHADFRGGGRRLGHDLRRLRSGHLARLLRPGLAVTVRSHHRPDEHDQPQTEQRGRTQHKPSYPGKFRYREQTGKRRNRRGFQREANLNRRRDRDHRGRIRRQRRRCARRRGNNLAGRHRAEGRRQHRRAAGERSRIVLGRRRFGGRRRRRLGRWQGRRRFRRPNGRHAAADVRVAADRQRRLPGVRLRPGAIGQTLGYPPGPRGAALRFGRRLVRLRPALLGAAFRLRRLPAHGRHDLDHAAAFRAFLDRADHGRALRTVSRARQVVQVMENSRLVHGSACGLKRAPLPHEAGLPQLYVFLRPLSRPFHYPVS